MRLGGYPPTHRNQTPNTVCGTQAVRQWAIRFIVERETAQIAS